MNPSSEQTVSRALLVLLGCFSVVLAAAAAGQDTPPGYPVPTTPYTATYRSVALEDLIERNIAPVGVYRGSPKVRANRDWYEANFYATLASRKIWHPGTGPDTHELGGPITWDIVPIPQAPPPPCDQPQPTGYDAEGCRYVQSLFKDVAAKDPAKAQRLREAVRRGRDVWIKGTFGTQDVFLEQDMRFLGKEATWMPWLDTRERKHRFTKWGFINDPDCSEGDESTYWMDQCPDPHSAGVLGFRKYLADPTRDASGKVVFDPASSPYRPDELKKNLRYTIGGTCVQCHIAFDPTHPPKDPNRPGWENLHALIGNQHHNNGLQAFTMAAPADHPARQVLGGARPGTVDTSIRATDFQHNPGTQNNVMDFQNRRVFEHMIKDPFTGEIRKGLTQHVLKGGEDSVGDQLTMLRVYVNIGMCSEECWVPHFPVPGTFFGEKSRQSQFSVKQCAADCEAWNYADAKMDHLASFLITGGPTYLLKARDVDGTPGGKFIDLAKVPQGRKVFARECASCHSTKVAPENVRADREALARFYEGHVFGKEDYWQYEFTEAERNSREFRARHLARDGGGGLRPRQFTASGPGGGGVFGQDWLGNDELTPFNIIGTNMCRALHDNHSEGHIFAEWASETYRQRPSPGSVPRVLNRLLPLVGGMRAGEKKIEGGPGYLRNISLLSVWATAPFLHNNAIGELTYLADGSPDYTVAGRIKQFEMAFEELMKSDNPGDPVHREPKVTVTDRDIKLPLREDMQGFLKLPVQKGTPVAYIASADPHSPLFMKCDDPVENKGHQFGVSLSAEEKLALREFLKLM